MAFNNHDGSTRSYDYVREHNDAVSRIDFISPRSEITAEAAPGEAIDVEQHDGTILRLRRLHAGYDPRDRGSAMAHGQALQAAGEIATGLLYVEPDAPDLHAALNTAETPLNALDETALCPGSAALEKINAGLR